MQQQTIRPACVLFPETTKGVSEAVQILAKHTANGSCEFAIRSGGHTSWAGASNIAGGVTLDLRRLDSIDLSEGGKTVRVGSGATWDAIYRKLDPLGRSVAGGRVAGVGVGGLTLGGGISHLSPQHGWTCDTVRNQERSRHLLGPLIRPTASVLLRSSCGLKRSRLDWPGRSHAPRAAAGRQMERGGRRREDQLNCKIPI